MLRGSEKHQERVLVLIGTAVLLCAIASVSFIAVNPFGGRPADQMSVAINTPYVGQGVAPGTAVVMHGVEVGKVTSVALSPSGGVRLVADLHRRPVAGISESMNIDFRPVNYFGVPGINLIPSPGGQALRDGSEISLVPKGNFTLTELLYQLGDVSASALTPRLISVIDRVTRYTDGLNPLFETLVIATKALADVQSVSAAKLLSNTAPISATFPPFAGAVTDAGTSVVSYKYYPGLTSAPAATGPRLTPPFVAEVLAPDLQDESQDYFENVYHKFLDTASKGLFLAVGTLESTHVDDLLPLIDGIKSLSDTVPPLLRPDDIARTLAELRSRFERLYAGNGQQRALQVRILLDSFPGVAAPLGIGFEGSPPGGAAPPQAGGSPGR